MEEILASIRRMIADDEAKPTFAGKAAEPIRPATPRQALQQPTLNDIPPSRIVPPKPPADRHVPPPAAPKQAPAPTVTNVQDNRAPKLAELDKTISVLTRSPEPDVLELTDAMVVNAPAPAPAPPPLNFRSDEPEDHLKPAESVGLPPLVSASRRSIPVEGDSLSLPTQPPVLAPTQQSILAQSTVSAVESAFSSLTSNLTNTVLSNNARTLEDLVKEMLRPMLKSWLDDNLPGLVERLVKAEIERVSRGP